MTERIVKFESLGRGRILLTFEPGEVLEVDLNPLIERGGAYSRLADDGYLSQATLEDWGHTLEWPGELDMGADTLHSRGTPVSSATRIPAIAQ
jgi:hypothetical protein